MLPSYVVQLRKAQILRHVGAKQKQLVWLSVMQAVAKAEFHVSVLETVAVVLHCRLAALAHWTHSEQVTRAETLLALKVAVC